MSFLVIEFLDYWSAGSGSGRGHVLDLVPLRTPAGLPYLPGRTLRGLLRDALRRLEALGHLPPELPGERALFGSRPGERSRYDTQPGALRVGDALPPDELEAALLAEKPERRERLAATLFRTLASTAMEDGLARQDTLRRLEFAIPLRLRARIDPLPGAPKGWERSIELALPLLRAAGIQRSRGFGRLTARLEVAP